MGSVSGSWLGHGELQRGEIEALGGVAGELHVAVGHEAEAVDEHLLQPELLRVLEEDHAGRRHRPADDGLGIGAADARELGGQVIVAGAELLVGHVDARGGRLRAELIARAHPEGAGVVQHRHVLDVPLLEEVEEPRDDLGVVHGGLEHPRAVLHRLDERRGAGHAHERHLGALNARDQGQADVAPVAVADDHVDLVLLDEALGREHGLRRLARPRRRV